MAVAPYVYFSSSLPFEEILPLASVKVMLRVPGLGFWPVWFRYFSCPSMMLCGVQPASQSQDWVGGGSVGGRPPGTAIDLIIVPGITVGSLSAHEARGWKIKNTNRIVFLHECLDFTKSLISGFMRTCCLDKS